MELAWGVAPVQTFEGTPAQTFEGTPGCCYVSPPCNLRVIRLKNWMALSYNNQKKQCVNFSDGSLDIFFLLNDNQHLTESSCVILFLYDSNFTFSKRLF